MWLLLYCEGVCVECRRVQTKLISWKASLQSQWLCASSVAMQGWQNRPATARPLKLRDADSGM